ncbi:MAG: agmatine deiminase family protein [Desulfobacterales bacterium]|nr:agmatine deiminase family protein [Desulfobacterales bacterium]
MATNEHNPIDYYMPAEWEKHEGTWFQWPNGLIDPMREMKLENTWFKMVNALHDHENVHIMVENEKQENHVREQLIYFGIGFKNIDIHIIPTNEPFARDNAPIFVVDNKGNQAITNWGFNGWGGRSAYELDEKVPEKIAEILSMPMFSPPLIMEGGGFEVNGKGTFMASRTSIMNDNRNPGKSQKEVEEIIKQHLGIKHFIWLSGAGEEAEQWGDVTDSHIDIVARFVGESSVLYNRTDDETDPRYNLFKKTYEELKQATTATGEKLTLIPLPVPKVYRISPLVEWSHTTFTDGAYSNYLVANNVVLVPVFGHENDEKAKQVIADCFPGREVIGIQCVELTEEGGAIHCVTQQQPAV